MPKEDIRTIIEGKNNITNFFEDITNCFTQWQISVLNHYRINFICYEVTGEIILEVRRCRQHNIEPFNIIVYRYSEENVYQKAIHDMGINIVKMCNYKMIYDNEYFIDCWDYSVKVTDIKTFLYKVNRNLNRKAPDLIKRHNPISKKYNDRTHKGFYRFVRQEDFARMIYYQNHIEQLEEIYDLLEDDESKQTLVEIIRSVCDADSYRYIESSPDKKYWECYKHLDDECWVNCGACYGDTIMWFMMNGYKYKYIDAYEGDKKSAGVLKNNIAKIHELKAPINVINQYIGICGNIKTIDELYEDRRVTLINMDIEGAELNVLKGGVNTIKNQRPVLAVCAYHKPEDLVTLPKFVRECSDDYVFYLRKYPCGEPTRIIEFVYYMVPRERTI